MAAADPDPGVRLAVASASLLGESPFWHPRDQVLWWCDIPGRRLNRWNPASAGLDHWDFDSEPGCIAPALDGSLLLAMRDGLWRFDPASGARRRLAPPPYDPAHERFNDGKCDPQGRFWAGSMDFDAVAPTGTLYRFDADARCTPQDGGFPVCNGPAWSLDGRTLYFNDTVGARTLAYDFDPASGGVSGRDRTT